MWNQKVNLQNNTAKLKYLNTSPENSSQMKINQLFKQIEKKKKGEVAFNVKKKSIWEETITSSLGLLGKTGFDNDADEINFLVECSPGIYYLKELVVIPSTTEIHFLKQLL